MRRRKVSVNHRHQLLQIFLHMGRDEAEEWCLQANLHRSYAINYARALGLAEKVVPRGGGDIASSVDHSDPRWRWAIERGPVIAP